MQILDCFLFEINEGNLLITATDNANMMKCRIELNECDGNGAFCIPNRIIQAAVKEMADQPISFNVNTNEFSEQFTNVESYRPRFFWYPIDKIIQ